MPEVKISERRKPKKEEIKERIRQHREAARANAKKQGGSGSTTEDLEQRIEALEEAVQELL